jgi:hypothetical protein
MVDLVLAGEAPCHEESAITAAEMVDVQPLEKRRPVPLANDDPLRSDHGHDLC